MNMSNSINKWLLSATAFSMALIINPTFAFSEHCYYAADPTGNQGCETEKVSANKSGHFVYYEASPKSKYRIWDIDTGVMVREGTAGKEKASGNIFGLYGNYKMKVWGSLAGWAYINNT